MPPSPPVEPHAPATDPARSGSRFADARAAREAIAMALPMIEPLVPDPQVCGSGFLFIVVLDPALRAGEVALDAAILAEHAVGDRSRWDADYAAFARAKAALAWRTGLDAQRVQEQWPQLLGGHDTLLGGAVVLDGIVVAVSGAHPWYDELFATCVAAGLRAVAKRRHAQARQGGALFADDAPGA